MNDLDQLTQRGTILLTAAMAAATNVGLNLVAREIADVAQAIAMDELSQTLQRIFNEAKTLP